MQNYYSNGKLLLTGEYVVLDGAVSLAIPTKYGQSLKIELIDEPAIYWKSLDENGSIWFEDKIEMGDKGTLNPLQKNATSIRIVQIFSAIKQLNSKFLNTSKGFNITTSLDFAQNWGLGSSSTLINNLAQWTNIDAFKLLEHTFGGSGYDIACAQNDSSILYELKNGIPKVKPVDFDPPFKEHLYFVHLNKKQNSREGIAHYKAQNNTRINDVIEEVNVITNQMISCDSLEAFKALMNQHESVIANITNQETVTQLYFNDFKGSIKSLGAWGGDFILVALKENPADYFKNKGYETIIPYSNMIL
ncbi:GYDIA family GHMP kinase [Seonamhaeicola sp. MEBiC1930]|uniref:GYDIA family GHMP kinase n=1 Tax=Seonamhaeicola sp. MEBiC01930 TaxID=2976768 RepID=UPI0032452A4C